MGYAVHPVFAASRSKKCRKLSREQRFVARAAGLKINFAHFMPTSQTEFKLTEMSLSLRKVVAAASGDQPSIPHPSDELPQPSTEVTTAITATASEGSLPDALELESLMLNIDASLRVHARHQFFSWTQGLLQNLLRHELLICALRSGEPLLFHVDSFATSLAEPGSVSEIFRRDTSLVPHLIKSWEDNYFRPVICEIGSGSQFAQIPLARELARLGADAVLVHGTYDVFGKLASFFVLALKPESRGPRQIYLAEVLVPFLHLAWVRTQINRPAGEGAGVGPGTSTLLTAREQEILKWIHLGKSNIEIGAILGISPLTVKNHVQKILRKLNVQNRAQAVGRGLALRILTL
jgi:transcriptional regulator EpsA